MKDIITELQKIEKRISGERGSFRLFGVFLRETADDQWDLVASADWADDDKPTAMASIAREVSQQLDTTKLRRLSRVVIVDADDPAVASLGTAFRVEHGSIEIKDCNLFGMQIRHAHLITSLRKEPKLRKRAQKKQRHEDAKV